MRIILKYPFLYNKFEKKPFLKRSVHFNGHITLFINRSLILSDTITKFSEIKNKQIKINYLNEYGVDAGGLKRDWYSSVWRSLIESRWLVPTPNGTKLTFNNKDESNINAFFIGQFIATAILQDGIIGEKIARFIIKIILNQSLDIEDMKDYDEEIYRSLKWISENDVSPLMINFVNSEDIELIENGRNIYLSNENKIKYINLIIEDVLMLKNIDNLIEFVDGFRNILNIDNDIIMFFTVADIEGFVFGEDFIDVNDWMFNTKYDKCHSKYFSMLFNVIKKWPTDKQRKLLKFGTGLSHVPIGGFKELCNYGGLFNLNFVSREGLPFSHTCMNTINMPMYQSEKEYDEKLSLAIECDTYGFL